MDSGTLSAVNAYKNQLKLIQQGDGMPANDGMQPSFMDTLKEITADAIRTQKNAEALQMDAMTGGNVDLTDLVTAVADAELTVNTVVAVRDRVISAYQDIMRMPI